MSDTERFDDIPLEYTDAINFRLFGNSSNVENLFGGDDINETIYAPDVYGKRITLAYVPSTENDSAIISQYGGIFSTPAYLVKLKPQFVIDGEVVAEGSACNTGYMQKYDITLSNTASIMNDSEVTNTVTVGGMYSVVLDYGNVSSVEAQNIKDRIDDFSSIINDSNSYTESIMGELLNAVGKIYFSDLDYYNQAIAGQRDVTVTRSLSLGIVGFKANASYLFNVPQEITEGGIFLDIGHDSHSVVSNQGDYAAEKQFMLQAGVYSSAMEHGVLEQLTGIESVSTIKVLQYAVDNNIPIHYITKDNLESEISELAFSANMINEIRTQVNSGKVIVIPEHDITINQWTGVGYMVLDPDTCACGYMISGGMAGGAMTWYEVLGAVVLNVVKGVAIGLGFMLLSAICPWLAPILAIAACVGAFMAGWSIGTHIYNFIDTGNVREFQEGMIELASFCLVIGIFEGLKGKTESDASKNPETAENADAECEGSCKEGKCFVAGTLVSTSTGLVPIENIKAGDVVLSFNEKTLEVSEQIVEETFVRESKELVKITAGDEIITTTPEHRFYMPKKGFVDAIDLRAGDSLWTVNGECVIIEEVQHEMLESSVKVYNFRVANNHTYFVGNNAIAVHNEYSDPLEFKEYTPRRCDHPVEVYDGETAKVSRGKIETFMRGKVQCENFEVKKARLTELMKIKNPSAVEKAEINELKYPVKNYERSLEMSISLEKAGIVDSPEENMRIAKQLISDASKLDASNGIEQKTESILEGPQGKMVMEGFWILQDDGCWYLKTVILKYINGEG